MIANETQKKKEKDIFSEIWKLYMQFYNTEQNEQYWELLKTECENADKRMNDKYGHMLLICIMEILHAKSTDCAEQEKLYN